MRAACLSGETDAGANPSAACGPVYRRKRERSENKRHEAYFQFGKFHRAEMMKHKMLPKISHHQICGGHVTITGIRA